MWAHLGVFCGGLAQEETSDPSHCVAQPDKLQRMCVCVRVRPRVLACVSGGLNTIKNVIHNQGLVAGLLGKPSTTSVCVITQLRGRKHNGASKSKHWPAAFLNAIFPFTPTMNFYCPHWLQLFITGSADECTRWHLHWRKWPPEPIKWSSTHLQRATSSPVLLSFKDLATSVVWWVTASCSCYLCLDSQTCRSEKNDSNVQKCEVFTGCTSANLGQLWLTHERMCTALFTWQSRNLKSGYQGTGAGPKIHSRINVCSRTPAC